MLVTDWMKELDTKCGAVLNAYEELYAHTDTLEADPGMTKEQLEEVFAVAVVKIARMHRNIENLENDSEDETEVIQ